MPTERTLVWPDGSIYRITRSSSDRGEWRTLTAGEAASVPPETVHTFRVGPGPARVRNVHRPALDFDPYIKRLCSAASKRNLGDLSDNRALLYIAVLVREFPEKKRACSHARRRATFGTSLLRLRPIRRGRAKC